MDSPSHPPNSVLKERVRLFWDADPCGSRYIEAEEGTREYYEEFDRFREAFYPYLDEVHDYGGAQEQDVLEIGVGLGADLTRYARAGARVTGMDLTMRAVKETRRRFSIFGLTGSFLEGDAENLPFPDESFDRVVSIGVLHHTPDTARAIREVRRVLRPGGLAVIMLYHRDSFRYRVVIPVLRRVHPRFRKMSDEEIIGEMYDGRGNPLGKVYSRREIEQLFTGYVLEDLSVRNFASTDIPVVGRFIPRRLLLATVGRMAGLDLYIRARKA